MQKRWQDSAGLVLGILLFLSPWIIGFSGITAAAASAWAIGADAGWALINLHGRTRRTA